MRTRRYPKPLSAYDYRWVTEGADQLSVPHADLPALPELIEPSHQPLVTDPVDEPLVRVVHRDIRVLSVYWHAGWPAARPDTLLRSGALSRLITAVESLPSEYGLAVMDAWRPLGLQADIFDTAYADPLLPPGFVTAPSDDPTTPPPHLTGGTVDVTLTWRGRPLGLGTPFDAFTSGARTNACEGTPGRVRDLRRMLFWAMRDAGFVVLDQEWWHFEFGTRRWAAITDNDPLYGPAHIDVWGRPAAARLAAA